MASITIRNIDEGTKQRLKEIAKQNGRSVESHVRFILDGVTDRSRTDYYSVNLGRSRSLDLTSAHVPTEPATQAARQNTSEDVKDMRPQNLADEIHSIMKNAGVFFDGIELPARTDYTKEITF